MAKNAKDSEDGVEAKRWKSKRIRIGLLGIRMKRKTLLELLGFVLLLPLLLGLVAWLLITWSTTGVPTGEALDPREFSVDLEQSTAAVDQLADEPMDASAVLDFYWGQAGMADLESLVYLGEYIENGSSFEWRYMVKTPHFARKEIRNEQMEVHTSYDGDTAQLRVEGADGQVVEQEMEASLYRLTAILEATFLPREWNDRLGLDGELKEHDSNACWVLSQQVEAGALVAHWIDSEFGLERVRVMPFVADGSEHELAIHFVGYRKLEGRLVPEELLYKLDDTLLARARVETVQFNSGLMPWMFR